MKTEEQQPSIFEKISTGIRNSISLKLILITILTLLLLIPMSMIRGIIAERAINRTETELEVSDKWARQQTVTGPILSIPVLYQRVVSEDEIVSYTKNLNILPNQLMIDGTVLPETLNRGIYDITVYSGELNISGDFTLARYRIDDENFAEIQWDNAFLTIGLSDLRGIRKSIPFQWNGSPVAIEPGSKIQNMISSGVTIPVSLNPEQLRYSFTGSLDIQGSENLSFVPLGNETRVSLESNWPDPSFMGSFLPDEREISQNGFTANWSVLQLNRNYPQKWFDDAYASEMHQSSFGVKLFNTLDDYQKSTRSAKYAVMTLALTFLIFFLTEVLNHRRIHPFQYTLVGLALSVFYVLLVSISEHLNFNIAYMISSLAIIAMITFYASYVFRSRKITLLLAMLLTAIYAFVFVTLQLADYALLIGSIGLAAILSATMFYTRNINWYKLSLGSQG
ncbi:cell envelope integrity protein CreD [Fulvivirga sedimenti]|uniref:Cell envelope integrity protein CreD n=1 Tax=Fulvivirga sedimenti TaxID=2879465 RepID=A0A9X1HMU4_9BACT|nr:cell envelope integrity protein CreD [Fulvivirga sedimenti]MCA6073482.1 cell envelope integrity protein CreD [Fulvivirga sedimenti]